MSKTVECWAFLDQGQGKLYVCSEQKTPIIQILYNRGSLEF